LAWVTYVFPPARNTGVATAKYAWVQMLPDRRDGNAGGRLVRAIVAERDGCPTVTEDGRPQAMRKRSPPSRTAFPVLICETELAVQSAAQLDGRMLPARPIEPNDIVVIGDTGCRMVFHSQDQSCFDGEEWPFRSNAASAAAKISPQSLVLHVGDFHYREHPCVESDSNCGGSPYGDNWETWEAEFFSPADRLLLAAPWIVLRGNHEDCARAGAGWLFFFALPGQRGKNAACESSLDAYTVGIGHTEDGRTRSLLVMDTSDADNGYKAENNCAQYRKALTLLDQSKPDLPPPEFWLALHQPLWGRNMDGEQETKPQVLSPCVDTVTKSALPVVREKFEKAMDKRLARLVLSGDNHAFQFFAPKTTPIPIQIIAGNGGTKLDTLYPLLAPDAAAPPSKGRTPDETPPHAREIWSQGVQASNLTVMQHGFTVLHRGGSTWTATQFDSTGGQTAACRFSETVSGGASDSKLGCDL
jgi:hypothetical protein